MTTPSVGSDVMRLLQHIASTLLLIGLMCPAAQAADQPDPLADEIARRAAAKWRAVLARIDSEGETLAACRASPDACSPAARLGGGGFDGFGSSMGQLIFPLWPPRRRET